MKTLLLCLLLLASSQVSAYTVNLTTTPMLNPSKVEDSTTETEYFFNKGLISYALLTSSQLIEEVTVHQGNWKQVFYPNAYQFGFRVVSSNRSLRIEAEVKPAPVPVPASIVIFASSLLALSFFPRKVVN